MKKIVTLILIFISTFSFSQEVIKNVDAAAFKKMIDDKIYILIDLRTADEIKNKGKNKGATELDFLDKNAEANIEKLDKKKSYLIYCAGGGRSGGDCSGGSGGGGKHASGDGRGASQRRRHG